VKRINEGQDAALRSRKQDSRAKYHVGDKRSMDRNSRRIFSARLSLIYVISPSPLQHHHRHQCGLDALLSWVPRAIFNSVPSDSSFSFHSHVRRYLEVLCVQEQWRFSLCVCACDRGGVYIARLVCPGVVAFGAWCCGTLSLAFDPAANYRRSPRSGSSHSPSFPGGGGFPSDSDCVR